MIWWINGSNNNKCMKKQIYAILWYINWQHKMKKPDKIIFITISPLRFSHQREIFSYHDSTVLMNILKRNVQLITQSCLS